MSVLAESAKLLTYYDMAWAKKHGIAKKDIRGALNLISEVSAETNHSIDEVETAFVSLYHKQGGNV